MPHLVDILLIIGHLAASLLYVVLIFFVLARSVRSSAHWAYAIIVFGLLGWTLTLYLYLFVSLDDSFLILVGRANYAFGSIVPVGLAAFFFFFPSRTPWIPRVFLSFYAIFSLFIFFLSLFTPYVDEFEIMTSEGPYPILGSLYWLYGIHMFGSAIFAIALGAVKVFFLHGLDRTRFQYAYYVFVPMIILGFLLGGFLPIFGIVEQFRYMFLSTLPIALSTFYAIWYYRFFQLSYIALKILRFSFFIIAFLVIVLSVHVLIIPPSVDYHPYGVAFGSLLGLFFVLFLERLFPEFATSEHRLFREKIADARSKIYSCKSSVALQKVLENSFVLGMNYAQAKVYFVRCQDGFSHHQALCYDKNQFTETLETRKNVLVLEELRLQKKEDELVQEMKALGAELCYPLFVEGKCIGFFILGKKENSTPYAREEIHTFSEFTKDLSIATMNVILQMSIREENSFMKKIIEEKTKNLRKQYKTVQKLANAQMDFISIMAHEFRTPLSVALFQMEELFETHSKKDLPLEQLKILESSLMKLKTLLQKLFDAQQYDFDNIKLQKGKTEIPLFLQEIVRDFDGQNLSPSAKVLLKSALPKSFSMNIDASQIRQVLHNLIRNALRFAPKGSTVELFVEKKPDGILFSIRDHGRGIPKKDRERIFQKFETRKTPEGRGMGLGLYICKKIVQLHKGSIWAENAPGGGTLFCFLLPL